jgi:hypothetical protein
MQYLKRYVKDGLDLIVDLNYDVIYGWKRGYTAMSGVESPHHTRNRYKEYYRYNTDVEKKRGLLFTNGGSQIISLIDLSVLIKWLCKDRQIHLVEKIESLNINEVVRELRLQDTD